MAVAAVCLLMLIGAAVVYLTCIVKTTEAHPIAIDASENVAIISDGQGFSQQFTSPVDHLTGVTVRASLPGGKPETGEIVFALRDEQENIIAQQAFEAAKIRSNAPMNIAFPEYEQAQGKAFTLEIQGTELAGDTPVGFRGGNEGIGIMTLPDGSAVEDRALSLTVTSISYTYSVWFVVAAIMVVSALLPVLAVCANGKERGAK